MASVCHAATRSGSDYSGKRTGVTVGRTTRVDATVVGAGAYAATNRERAELAAPLSLLVDHFGLPAESFLTQVALNGNEAQSDVVVHPIENDQLLNAVSLSQASLALLTRELVLTVEDAVLENVDLLDIPSPRMFIPIHCGRPN